MEKEDIQLALKAAVKRLEEREATIITLRDGLQRIASYQMPEEMEENEDDDSTEWGVSREEAIEMAYENVIWEAQHTLQSANIKQTG